MKKAILIFLIFFGITIYSQTYEPFINTSKKWMYSYICEGPCHTYEVGVKYYFDGDTVIDSKTYQKLYGEMLYYNQEVWNIEDSIYLAALIRENITEKKVFMYYGLDVYSNDSMYNTEQIFLDFSLSLGDTLTSYSSRNSAPGSSFDYIVQQIDTFTLNNNTEILRYYYNNAIFQQEQIGSENILIDPIWVVFPLEPKISCIKSNNEFIYGDNCTYLSIVNKTDNLKDYIKVYPNVVSNNLNIESEIVGGNLYLYNNNSQCILNEKLNLGVNKISLNNFNSGVYYYLILSDNNIFKGKIIKIN